MAKIACPKCGTENDQETSPGYCFQCGRDLPGTAGADVLAEAEKRIKENPPIVTLEFANPAQKTLLEAEQEARREVPITLLAVALVPALCGIAGFTKNGEMPPPIIIVELLDSIAMFAGLAAWGRYQPYPAAVCGLALYVFFSVMWIFALRGSTSGLGLLVRLFLIGLLIRAVNIANRYRNLKIQADN